MSRVADELQSWPADPESELLGDLKKQLEAVKARLTEHRAQMEAAGLAAAKTPEQADAGGQGQGA